MKHRLLFIAIAILFGAFWHGLTARAAEPFISNFWTASSGKTHIDFCWTQADTINQTPTFVGQSDNTLNTLIPPGDYTMNPVVDYSQPNMVCVRALGLPENTDYMFWVEYAAGTTTNGHALSEYSDFIPAQNKLVSVVYHSRTSSSTALVTSLNYTYVMADETIRLYGDHLGTGPASLTGHVARLGSGDYQQILFSGNYYQFPIVKWTDKYIDLKVPTYDATKLRQSGKLYFDDIVFEATNYPQSIFVTMLHNVDDVDRALISKYHGNVYRTLMNASRFRYNVTRTATTQTDESTQMKWVQSYLKSKGRGVDAAWSLVLAYARVYGGYTADEVMKEIFFGPGCIHSTIRRDAWSQTSSYKSCMAHTLR